METSERRVWLLGAGAAGGEWQISTFVKCFCLFLNHGRQTTWYVTSNISHSSHIISNTPDKSYLFKLQRFPHMLVGLSATASWFNNSTNTAQSSAQRTESINSNMSFCLKCLVNGSSANNCKLCLMYLQFICFISHKKTKKQKLIFR